MGDDRAAMPDEGLRALSAREKEVLRLLLAGHDAKSSAQALSLSVHTVNEHLREARRKLGVTSSRAAARRLAEAEVGPNSLGTKQLGVADPPPAMLGQRHRGAGHSLAWLGGGMLIMSLVVAIAALSFAFHGGATPQAPAAAVAAPQAASASAARDWLALVDQQKWEASWDAAAALFKAQLPRDRWAAAVQAARAPLGALKARTFQSVNKTSALPGAPAGDYEILQFQARFAQASAVETVTLVREGAVWRVIGYYVR